MSIVFYEFLYNGGFVEGVFLCKVLKVGYSYEILILNYLLYKEIFLIVNY